MPWGPFLQVKQLLRLPVCCLHVRQILQFKRKEFSSLRQKIPILSLKWEIISSRQDLSLPVAVPIHLKKELTAIR